MENSVSEARWLLYPLFGLAGIITAIGFLAG